MGTSPILARVTSFLLISKQFERLQTILETLNIRTSFKCRKSQDS